MTGVQPKSAVRPTRLTRWNLAGYLLLVTVSAFADPATDPKADPKAAPNVASQFHDPLDTPAQMRHAVEQRPLMAVVHAGERLVAVGSRGVIVGSDDHGKTWVQAKVPVQSDLLAVHFPSASDGWAVGHDGVILHSADGGKTWTKQLDGRIAADSFQKFYSAMGAAGAAPLAQLGQNYKAGPALPFLDVWFEDAQRGFAVGSFGMIIATTDGGKNWEPWLHRIDNPQSLNLNAIHGLGSELYIVGERGQIYRLDRTAGRFTATDTGYIGSFFGIVGNGETLIAYGLRGTAYRGVAKGGGVKSGGLQWEVLAVPNEHTLGAGIVKDDGSFVLVNAAGQFVLIDKAGRNARLAPASRPMRLTGVVADGDAMIVTGLDGIRREKLQADASAR